MYDNTGTRAFLHTHTLRPAYVVKIYAWLCLCVTVRAAGLLNLHWIVMHELSAGMLHVCTCAAWLCLYGTQCNVSAEPSTLQPAPGLTLMYTLCIMDRHTLTHTHRCMNYVHVRPAAYKYSRSLTSRHIMWRLCDFTGRSTDFHWQSRDKTCPT